MMSQAYKDSLETLLLPSCFREFLSQRWLLCGRIQLPGTVTYLLRL